MSAYLRPRVPGASVFFTVALAERGSDLLVREVARLREVAGGRGGGSGRSGRPVGCVVPRTVEGGCRGVVRASTHPTFASSQLAH